MSPDVDPMLASVACIYVGRRNANPHSSDRKGGGDDGVRTTRSAAGAARLYNLRLPTEGLRQGHGLGLGPAPGFRWIVFFKSSLLCLGYVVRPSPILWKGLLVCPKAANA